MQWGRLYDWEPFQTVRSHQKGRCENTEPSWITMTPISRGSVDHM